MHKKTIGDVINCWRNNLENIRLITYCRISPKTSL